MLHILFVMIPYSKTVVLSFQRSNFMCDDIYVFDIYHIGKRNFLFLFSLSPFAQTFIYVFDIYCIVPVRTIVVSYTHAHIETQTLLWCSMCRRKNNTLNAHIYALFRTLQSYFLMIYLCALSLSLPLCALCAYLPFGWHNDITYIRHNIQLHDTRCEREATCETEYRLNLLASNFASRFSMKWFNCVTKTNIVIQC